MIKRFPEVCFTPPEAKEPRRSSSPLALIANPTAGGRKGNRLIQGVVCLLRRHGIDYRLWVTQYHEHALKIAEKLQPRRFDGIVAIGGDGTNFQMLNGLLKNHDASALPPLGIIPVGSGNAFAQDLGLRAAADSIRALIDGTTRPVDVGRFTQAGAPWYFINMVGLGFVTDVARTAQKWRRFGDLGYMLGVIRQMLGMWRFHHLQLEVDDIRIAGENCFVEVCNSRYTGRRMLMAPDARIDDGLFDVVIVGPLDRRSLMANIPRIFRGTHDRHPAVRFLRAGRVALKTASPMMLLADGELFGSTPTEITIHPRLVRYFA